LANAASIVLCHNHPSGEPTPSPDDLQLTRRLVAAGMLLGVEVLDHIIVGDAGYYSFKQCDCL
jgi:DNA repair protein RadC